MRVDVLLFDVQNLKIGQLVKRGGELLIFFLFSSYRVFLYVLLFLFVCFPSKFAKNTAPAIKKTTIQELREFNRSQSTPVNASYTQPAVRHKVVFGPRLGTTLLHAPGTKMT